MIVACPITNSRTAKRKFQIFFRILFPVKLFPEKTGAMHTRTEITSAELVSYL